MKKIFLALMAVAAITLTGCKESDEPKSPVSDYYFTNLSLKCLLGHEYVADDFRDDLKNAIDAGTVRCDDDYTNLVKPVVDRYNHGYLQGDVNLQKGKEGEDPVIYKTLSMDFKQGELYVYDHRNVKGYSKQEFVGALTEVVRDLDKTEGRHDEEVKNAVQQLIDRAKSHIEAGYLGDTLRVLYVDKSAQQIEVAVFPLEVKKDN